MGKVGPEVTQNNNNKFTLWDVKHNLLTNIHALISPSPELQ